VRFLDRYC